MTFSIAVCDDQAVTREKAARYLAQAEKETGDHFEIQYYTSGEECMEKLDPKTQVLFLDILMDGISGIEAGQKLRQRYPSLCIVFVTSESSYAIDGYRARAFGFLEKPVTYKTFYNELYEALGTVVKKTGTQITMNKGFTTEQINSNDIIYIEVMGHRCIFVLQDGEREYTKSLKDIQQLLDPSQFFKCHVSYLVNLKHVVKINQSDILMSNKKTVPLSKHRKKELQETFALYIGKMNPLFMK